MTPDQITKTAYEHAKAVGRNEMTLRDCATFASRRDAAGAAYYATIFASRIPAQWRDVFLAELLLKQLTAPAPTEAKKTHELYVRGKLKSGANTARNFAVAEPPPATAAEALKIPAIARDFDSLERAILETRVVEFRTL